MTSQLESSLALSQVAGSDIFTAESIDTPWGRLFGGQIIAQCVMAAAATVPAAFPIHSLHGYFLLKGKNGLGVMLEVERVRDGRSFLSRTVKAVQENRVIFIMTVSFHKPEFGMKFQRPIEDIRAYVKLRLGPFGFRIGEGDTFGEISGVPSPEALLANGVEFEPEQSASILRLPIAEGDRWVMWWGKHVTKFEALRDDYETAAGSSMVEDASGGVGDSRTGRFGVSAMDAAILAYMTDFSMVYVTTLPHTGNDLSFESTASLDHSIHFHQPFKADEWLMFHVETGITAGARGLARGEVFDRRGRLVASVQQEALIRPCRETDVLDGGRAHL